MLIADSFGNEFLDRFTQQFVTLIAEELFGLPVDQDDFPLVVDRNHCVGRYIEKGSKIFNAFLEGFFCLLSFRNVPGDLRKTTQLASLVFYGSNDSVGPKSRSVLPYPPPFILVMAISDGNLEFALRFAILYGLRRVE